MDIVISKMMSKPDFQSDFLANILKANANPDIITFAGGLPNAVSFPVEAMDRAADKVLKENGIMALQYSGAQGYAPLRKFIADRYQKKGIDVDASQIIITNGSQQALDMFSAVMIDPGDRVLVENPSYLAALQTFHLYDPEIVPVSLREDGIDVKELEKAIAEKNPKFMYLIPNFQNPTGLTYTEEVREAAAEVFKKSNVMVLEDDPYGELRFAGKGGKSFGWYLGEQCCMLGTFSKIVSPGMRIGWIACREQKIFDKLLAYKATMDLHTNMFCQMVLFQYLQDNDFDVYVVSGSDRFICRTLFEGIVDIPEENFIGMDVGLAASGEGDVDGLDYMFAPTDQLVRTDKLIVKNLKMNKVTAIVREIGKQPVLSFGNTSGASAPLSLVDRFGESDEDRELFLIASGFGIGLSWGVVDFRINAKDILPLTIGHDTYDDGYPDDLPEDEE